MKIPLNKPYWGKPAEAAVIRAMRSGSGVADGPESKRMRELLTQLTKSRYPIPVTSCTHAMEAAVACLGASSGDEVIVPSFTLASTATAVMIRGATPVFADIDPVTKSLDPHDVERVVTKRTKGIITVHYGGSASRSFDALRLLAKKRNLWIIEDAAHCIGAEYKGKALGTFTEAGALSFHGTKNVAAGEGGAILTNSAKLADAMEIFRSIGTDRMAFLRGKVSAYRWVGEGSSYMLSDLLAALVNVQLEQLPLINRQRKHIASAYTNAWKRFAGKVILPEISPGMTKPNWHIYALVCATPAMQATFLAALHEHGIEAAGHYVPLHTSPMGISLRVPRALPVTDAIASTIVRMPIYAGMSEKELDYVVQKTCAVLKSL